MAFMNSSSKPSKQHLTEKLLGTLLFLLLLYSPVAGFFPLPLTVMQFSGMLLLLLALLVPGRLIRHLHWSTIALLVLLVSGFALYLLPLPLDVWKSLPGRADYAEILKWADARQIHTMHPVSIIPGATLDALLKLMMAIGVFLASVVMFGNQHLKRWHYGLLILVVIWGFAEAALGLAQFGGGQSSSLRMNYDRHLFSALGTFGNRNHLSAFLEMILPLLVSAFAAILAFRHSGRARGSERKGVQLVLIGSIALVIFLAIVFTRSRAGLAATSISTLALTFILSREFGRVKTLSVGTIFGVVGIGAAVIVGIAPVLQRFSLDSVMVDNRVEIISNSIDGVKLFFPFGSGPGTFEEIYPRFQSVGQVYTVNHAHSDYVELLFETGLVGALILAWFFIVYFRRWVRLLKRADWELFDFLQAGAGVGILSMLLHELVEFNLHMPVVMLYFAFICGLFFVDRNSRMALK
jgi:O-antigen ligase